MGISHYKTDFSISDLAITPEEIGKVMGYTQQALPEPVLSAIEDALEEISGLGDIRAEYKIYDNFSIDQSDRSLRIDNSTFHLKNIIFSQIKNSDEVALFICTAGKTIDDCTKGAKKENDLLLEYVFDVIGSEIAEAAASKLQEHLREVKKAEGKNISMRFSPGYCGWDLQEQKLLFHFFPDNYCKVTLSQSSFMSPVKSISGIIGIGDFPFRSNYQCKVCKDKFCIYRNRKVKIDLQNK
jgi:hypothetical protein